MPGYIKFLLLITCIDLCSPLYSQVYVNDAGSREKLFIYRVNQIDEFIARFNNDENSLIRSEYRKYQVPYKVDRAKSIKSLFNFVSGDWTEDEINQLIAKATNRKNPVIISFYDKEWFAEVTCSFETRSGTVLVPLVLKVNANSIGSKWSIVSIREFAVTKINIYNAPPKLTNNIHKYLSPTSHNNDFLSLIRAFDDKEDLSCYFESKFFNTPTGISFYNQVLQNEIKLLHISRVRFYFFQVPGCVFIVDNFMRNELNSGWLISELNNIDDLAKVRYKNNLLGIN